MCFGHIYTGIDNFVFCFWVCEDQNDIASQFLNSVGRVGTCPELINMCNYVTMFVDGFQNFETVADICEKTCGKCFGKNLNFQKIVSILMVPCKVRRATDTVKSNENQLSLIYKASN